MQGGVRQQQEATGGAGGAGARARLSAGAPGRGRFGELREVVDALSGADVWARKADVLRARFGALSDAELSDTLREMFRRMDADGSGTLSEEELRAALAELGVQAEPTQVRAMLQVADADGDARVKEDEFVDVISSIRAGASRIQVALRRKGRSPLPPLLAGPLIFLIEARPTTPPRPTLPPPPLVAPSTAASPRGAGQAVSLLDRAVEGLGPAPHAHPRRAAAAARRGRRAPRPPELRWRGSGFYRLFVIKRIVSLGLGLNPKP